MCREDISQVATIDREAFPTTWPPINYHHELKNRLAHYIVVLDADKSIEEPRVESASRQGFSRLAARLKRLFDHDRFFGYEVLPPGRESILGFTGFWVMADKAHITNIAVREAYHRQGIGGLLLISIIDLAPALKARSLILEVRASNTAAQSLYRKYGFSQVGLRRGYYREDKEDAVLMSTEDITSAPFQAHLQQLKQTHSSKWGPASTELPDNYLTQPSKR